MLFLSAFWWVLEYRWDLLGAVWPRFFAYATAMFILEPLNKIKSSQLIKLTQADLAS